jgi:hypothetical protein
MKNNIRSTARQTPAHLWLVGLLGLLASAFAVRANVLTNIREAAYMARLPTDLVLLIDDFPAWMTAAWTLGVWSAALGSLLLLARSRWAIPALALAFAGILASALYLSVTGLPETLRTGAMVAILLAVGAAAIFLPTYAFRMGRKGVLR